MHLFLVKTRMIQKHSTRWTLSVWPEKSNVLTTY